MLTQAVRNMTSRGQVSQQARRMNMAEDSLQAASSVAPMWRGVKLPGHGAWGTPLPYTRRIAGFQGSR